MKPVSVITDVLDAHGRTQPDHRAFVFLSERLEEVEAYTFGELRAASRGLAVDIADQVGRGERAILLFEPGLDFVVAFLACLYAGAIAVPIAPPNKGRAQRNLTAIAADCGARVVLTDRALDEGSAFADGEAAIPWKRIRARDAIAAGGEGGGVPPPAHPADIAFLQYTSGSTSKPKGVVVSHGNIMANQRMIQAAFGHDRHSDFVGWVPHFHDQGLIGNILQPLYLGATSVLMSPVTFLRWPLHWLRAISRYKAHTSGGPSFAYGACLAALERTPDVELDLSHWKVAFNGAEPIDPHTLARFAERFARFGFAAEASLPCYGLAEATLLVSGRANPARPIVRFEREGLAHGQAIASPEGTPLVSCGPAIPGSRVIVVDPLSAEVLAEGQVGEVCVTGGHVTQGYWSEARRGAVPHALRQVDGSPYLRTGDLGFLLADELYLTGRIKDLIVCRGRNLYPQDIEQRAYESHPALVRSGCAAFATMRNGQEEVVVVQEIQRAWRYKVPVDELVGRIRRSVYQDCQVTPVDILIVLPGRVLKTSSGKIMRTAMRLAYESGDIIPWTGLPSRRETSHDSV